MRLITDDSLHYPITVTRLRRKQSDDIQRTEPLFDYEYQTTVIEGTDEDKEGGQKVVKTYPSTFHSGIEGVLDRWLIQPGMVITRPRTPVVDVREACRHEVQWEGICADCGKDMTQVNFATVARDTDRATVKAAYEHTGLLVSPAEASRTDEEAKRRLLSSRKLSLVVDLDQTIIQAAVEPTIGEWQKDPNHPNYEAVKDVRRFQLADDTPGARSCWYYIKFRPGLVEFLDVLSKLYECHIYTMGTRAYAVKIAQVVDPDRKIFGDRILSRDESGSMVVKNLKRLFPVDTKMVVIIDDRGDVWGWNQNLIKVTPYDFFVGIGDINSSFLPKRPGIDIAPPPPPPPPSTDTPLLQNGNGAAESADNESSDATNGTEQKPKHPRPTSETPVEPQANGDISAIDQLMNMGGKNDADQLQEQMTAKDETIAAQLADRPLLQKQKILDAQEEASPNGDSESAGDDEGNAEHNEHPSRYRHNLLVDNDTELHYLQQSLQIIHQKFFDEYDRRLKGSQGGRVSELRPGPSKKRSFDDLEILPDVTTIMADMKLSVLRGVNIVFSGVVPLGVDIHSHDLAVWAKSFGAVVTENITKRTTHVIAAANRRTSKVRQAMKRPGRISIVTQQWLLDSVSHWQRAPESAYRIHADFLDEHHKPAHESSGLYSPGLYSPIFDSAAENGMLSSSDEEAALTEDDADIPADQLTLRTNLASNNADDGEGTDTETDRELAQHMPALSRADSSPHEETKEDWDGMNDELAEFLGSDADDDGSASEAESAASAVDGAGSKKRKRVGPGEGSEKGEDGGESEIDAEGKGDSRLQKRKRKALARTTSLSSTAVLDKAAGGDPADPGGGGGGDAAGNGDGAGDGDEDDDLEAELAAEMARQAEEDGDE